jgi:hypothetical protein
MPPSFTWCNFIINALHLATGVIEDPNLLAQFLSQLTGHQFIRVDTSGGDVQNEGSENNYHKNQSFQYNGHPTSSVEMFSQPENKATPSAEELKLDDDENSYKLCSSGHGDNPLLLFNSADTARFPQGDLSPYAINGPKFKLS